MNYGPSTSCLLLLLYDEEEPQNVYKTVYSCDFSSVSDNVSVPDSWIPDSWIPGPDQAF